MAMAGVLAGHGAELSRARTTYGGDGMRRRDDARCGLGGCRGRAGVGDGGEIEDGGGGGDDRRVDRKVEDKIVRYI